MQFDARGDRPPVAAYLTGFVLIGVVLSTAGPALSHLRDRMGTDDGGIAWVFVGSSMGYIVGSTLAGRLLDRGHGHQWWAAAMAVNTAALVGLAAAPSLWLLVAAFVVIGAASGISDVCGNTLVMWSRPNGAGSLLNGLHLCFAVGALAAPLLVNRSIHWFDSVWGVAVVAGVLALASASALLRRPAPVRTRMEVATRAATPGARRLQVWLVAGFFFAYVALETGFAGWIHTYVEQIGYGDATTATAVVTVFWAGFTFGRAAAIWVARRVSPGWIVAISMIVAVVASVLFAIFPDGGPMLWVVTFVFAVSIAPQYASMMAFAESHLALSGRNTSLLVAMSGVGGLLAPWVVGQLFDGVGPEALPTVMVTCAVLTAVVGLVAGRAVLSGQRPPATSMNVPVT
jgi:MFS transporter, FHS family, Na+ dependent glucose transporter 1